MRLACSPAARATATGAHESHSYWPPACTYSSASPRTTAEILAPAEPMGTVTAPEALGHGGDERGRAGPAHHHPGHGGPRRQGRGLAGAEHEVESGQGHRPDRRGTVDGEGHVDGPVGPPLRVLAGAVERVDDPHPSGVGWSSSVGPVVLLGADPVLGEPLGQEADEQFVGAPVTLGPQLLALEAAALQLGQDLARPAGPARPPLRRRFRPLGLPSLRSVPRRPGPLDSLPEPGPTRGIRAAGPAPAGYAPSACRPRPPWTSPRSRCSWTPPSPADLPYTVEHADDTGVRLRLSVDDRTCGRAGRCRARR